MAGKRKDYFLYSDELMLVVAFDGMINIRNYTSDSTKILSPLSYRGLNVVSRTLNKVIVSILMIVTSTKSTDRGYHTPSKTEAAWDPATWHGIQ